MPHAVSDLLEHYGIDTEDVLAGIRTAFSKGPRS